MRPNPGAGSSRRQVNRTALLGILAAASTLGIIPIGPSVASASAAPQMCRPSVIVAAPTSSPIQSTVQVVANVTPCDLNVFSGDCTLERTDGGRVVVEDSGAVLGLGNCNFPTSSNAPGSRRYRVRFSGDRFHAPAVSRTFAITYRNPLATGGALRLGLAFVNSSVTSRGGAPLPAGTTVFPSGSKVSGTFGCPTSPFGQDGLMVLVLDYNGPRTSASVTSNITGPDDPQGFNVAPYYLDLNPGRQVQYLGPRNENATYDITVEYGYATATGFPKLTARFVLDRACQR